ncbi:putative phosphatase [Escherichia coli]|uniref:Putative phosphatase n=1 Tax=Escherichia coli TaxID=562 RepID=A0A376WRF6_ECOLX|nr:putative phosphatase [Escherichia coli]
MAIGDQENDIAMIEYAGVGVAMDNAIPSVKEVANLSPNLTLKMAWRLLLRSMC